MNVILIISDTLRRDCLGCYGAPRWVRKFKTGVRKVHTPHLDRFAQQSLIFDNAFITSFPTVPTRHDILTGRYTWTFKSWSPLEWDTVTLQDTLNRAGALTGLVADTPHPFAPGYNYQRGFQTWELIRGQEHDEWHADPKDVLLPCAPHKLRRPDYTVVNYLRNMSYRHWEEDYFPARTFREAARWLERNRNRAPFFLYIDTFDPHEPWDPPQYYTDLYDPGYQGEKVIYPRYDRCNYLSAAELNHCRALYCGEVTLVDHWFGYLFDRIESLGLLTNTAVIFLSDHGFYLGEHGYIGKTLITENCQQSLPLYPEVARIPLLACVPGTKGGRRIKSYVQTADLMPTICELVGAPVPKSVRARSFTSQLGGGSRQSKGFVICSPAVSHPGLDVPHPTTRSSIYQGDWLLVYGSQVHQFTDAETTRAVDSIMRRVETIEKDPIKPALYHLPSDPDCRRNVFAKQRDIAQALHTSYVNFLEEQDVPERHLKFFRRL